MSCEAKWVVASLLVLGSCATPMEAEGDRRRAAGDVKGALEAYRQGLQERPIMDFEFERVRGKAEALVDGDLGPRVAALERPDAGPRPLERCQAFLELRRAARDASEETKQRVRDGVARACSTQALRPALAPDGPAAVAQALALVETARQVANQGALDGLLPLLDDALGRPWPTPAPGTGLERLDALCALRERLRALPVPAATDARLDRAFEAAAPAGFTPSTAATARARFEALLVTRARARALHLPPPAVALVDAAHDEALARVLAEADAHAAARQYLRAFAALEPLTVKVEASHPLRARLQALLDEGAAWHRGEAEQARGGFLRALHLAAAAALAGDAARPAARAARAALRDDVTTTLAPKVTLQAPGPCAAIGDALVAALGPGTKRPLELRLTQCVADARDASGQRTANYVTEEEYLEQETVLVGHRRVQVQTGTQQVQCSKASSLPGYTWQGLCSQPVYGWKDEPIYETRAVKKVRDRPGSITYAVTTRVLTARVVGVARLTWDDGAALEVPVDGAWRDSAEQFAWQHPGRRLGERPVTSSARIPADFTAAAALVKAAQAAGTALHHAATAKARAYRAQLARADGRRALEAGDAEAAGEAFVRSVLLNDAVEAEALAWLEARLGVGAAVLRPLLLDEGFVRRVPGTAVALPAPPPWSSKGPTAVAGVADPPPKDVRTMTQVTYHEGVRGPAEFVDFHFGLVPWDVQGPGAGVGTRVAIPLVGDLHYHPLGMLLPLRYGFAVHDDAGLRGSFGFTTAARREYENGDKEPVLAASIDVAYALYLGLRTHYVSLYAGASAGFQHAANGHTWASGFHLEPAARLGLRLFRTYQLLVEATGFLPFVPGVARKDRLSISFPLLGSLGFDLKLSVERSAFPGSELAADGVTRIDLGPVQYQSAGVQVGARL